MRTLIFSLVFCGGGAGGGGFIKSFNIYVLILHTEFQLAMYFGTGYKVCVFYFGPGQALGLGLRLGQSQTIQILVVSNHFFLIPVPGAPII
jgi:hypothetical protein